CIISYLIFNYIKHEFIDFVMLFILILLFALQFSNLYIKSSMHTAFNVFVAALFFAFDVKIGFVWLTIAALVGITRVILKRHTVKEVFMGAGIAILVSFIYLYCNNKYQRNDIPTEVIPVETTIK
ncbi:phosphatase PAP2 family protein, partial [Chryseobacterium sp. 2TAF14]|uniref:phosphatase PAP2 family protein n=1 Tax=Chryseobacterium sp. 2TAF14 TaxID=3233007 RepID=UPI003F913858